MQRQIGRFITAGREHTLIREIVDREAGLGRRLPPCPFPLVPDHQRHQPGLPVVAVHQLWLGRQITRKVCDSFGEKNEPLGIVRVINTLFVVQLVAMKQIRLMHEVNCQSRLPLAFEDLKLNLVRAQRQVGGPVKGLDFGKIFEDAFVKWRDQADLQTGFGKRFRQCAHHVGQAARF